MDCIRAITDDIWMVGGSDRRLSRFENLFPIPRGVSYNAYLVLDEKTVLLDTVDDSVRNQFCENLERLLKGRPLDYLVVNHMEPDHCSYIQDLCFRYPNLKIIGNPKTFQMMKQFYQFDVDSHAVVIKEGETFSSGRHTFKFFMAPMVHWPEVMVTFDETDKILFSADAFGMFGALAGNVFDDEADFPDAWLADARRYYANIVGKFGTPVQNLLKKVGGLDIHVIAPLHGVVIRSHIREFVEKYDLWSRYVPEEKAVVIFYGTMYGHTQSAALALGTQLAKEGVKNIAMYDVSETDVSTLIAEIFRCSHLVFASPTYNAGIYPNMKNLLHDMQALALQNRHVALMENGTWAPASGRLMKALLEEMKGMEIIAPVLTIKSAMKPEQEADLVSLAQNIAADMA